MNLCFDNPLAGHLLSKQRDPYEIIGQLNDNRVLKFKLAFILLDPQKGELEINMETLVENVVDEIQKGLQRWDLNLINHVVDLFEAVNQEYPKKTATYLPYDTNVENLVDVSKTSLAN